MRLKYGAVLYVDNKGNKHIGYYDDDDEEGAIIYQEISFCQENILLFLIEDVQII